MGKIKLPDGFQFDGAKFGSLLPDFDPNAPDSRFWIDSEGYLNCPVYEGNIDLGDFEVDLSEEALP